ncbi:hypothetical protein BH11PLA1_BH11PLA1_22150 [soil metagenome]
MNTGHQAGTKAGTVRRAPRRGGFSIIEMLVALTISGTLLTACLVALDVMFKRYTVISDSASAHVVARATMHRVMQMIRTGKEFGPAPTDVLDPAQNPHDYDSIEFVSFEDAANGIREVTRLQKRASADFTMGAEVAGMRGPFMLVLVIDRSVNGVVTRTERPLIDGVLDAKFNLDYDVGPRLVRATVDITIQPTGSNYAKFDADTGTWTVSEYDDTRHEWRNRQVMTANDATPMIRLVSSTCPRVSTVDE